MTGALAAASGAPGAGPSAGHASAFGRELQAAQEAAADERAEEAQASAAERAAGAEGEAAASPPADPASAGSAQVESPASPASPVSPTSATTVTLDGRKPDLPASHEAAAALRGTTASLADPAAVDALPTAPNEPGGNAAPDSSTVDGARGRLAAPTLPPDGGGAGSRAGAAARAEAAEAAEGTEAAKTAERAESASPTGSTAGSPAGAAAMPPSPSSASAALAGPGQASSVGGPGGPMSTPTESAQASTPAFTLAPEIHSAAFPGALGLQLSMLARNGVGQARMVVNPEQMGPIAVQLALDGTQVRVDFVAENGQTRQLLQEALPGLAGALREAGLTLAGGGVFQQARDGRQPSAPQPFLADATGRRATSALSAGPAEGDLALQASRARRVRLSGLVDTFA